MTLPNGTIVRPIGDAETSAAVVGAVAEAMDVDPMAIEQPLYEIIDPDALDRLFRDVDGHWTRASGGFVQFTLADCQVVIRDSGEVAVNPHWPPQIAPD